jgi:predicted nucleotidyltransferase
MDWRCAKIFIDWPPTSETGRRDWRGWSGCDGKKKSPFANRPARSWQNWIGYDVHDAIQTTLADLAAFLSDQEVRFAVIGGIAVSVWGEPRFAADVVVVVGVDLAGALALIKAAEHTRFRPLFGGVEELVQTAFLLPLRHVDTQIKVDLAIGLSGFEGQIIHRAKLVELAGHLLPVATAEDLMLMKLLAARPRDVDDVSRIVARQRDALDWEYLFQTGTDLQEALGQDLVPQLQMLQQRSG